jgi:hypothetical protein
VGNKSGDFNKPGCTSTLLVCFVSSETDFGSAA